MTDKWSHAAAVGCLMNSTVDSQKSGLVDSITVVPQCAHNSSICILSAIALLIQASADTIELAAETALRLHARGLPFRMGALEISNFACKLAASSSDKARLNKIDHCEDSWLPLLAVFTLAHRE